MLSSCLLSPSSTRGVHLTPADAPESAGTQQSSKDRGLRESVGLKELPKHRRPAFARPSGSLGLVTSRSEASCANAALFRSAEVHGSAGEDAPAVHHGWSVHQGSYDQIVTD